MFTSSSPSPLLLPHKPSVSLNFHLITQTPQGLWRRPFSSEWMPMNSVPSLESASLTDNKIEWPAFIGNFPANNHADMVSRHSEFFSYFLFEKLPSSIDRHDVIEFFYAKVERLCESRFIPTLSHHVLSVVFVTSKEEMVRINASPVVAGVKDQYLIWEFPFMQSV